MARSRSTTPVANTSTAPSPRAVPRAMRHSPERPHSQAPYSRPDPQTHRSPKWRDPSPAWTLASLTTGGTNSPDADAVTISSSSSTSGEGWLNVDGREFPRPAAGPLPISNPLSPPNLPPSNPLSPSMQPLAFSALPAAGAAGPSTRPGLHRRPSTPPFSDYLTESEAEHGGKQGCANCTEMNGRLAAAVDMIANLARMQEAHQARQYWESERLSAMGAVMERVVQSLARIEQRVAEAPTAAGKEMDGDAEGGSLAVDIKMETELPETERPDIKPAFPPLPDIKTELPDLPLSSAPPGYPLYLAQLPDPHVLGDSVREVRTGLRTLEEKLNYLCTWTEDNTVHAPLAVMAADIDDMKSSLTIAMTRAKFY